ncbi:hypothetical protein B0H16DRAFT_1879405 [Mycena metata]|uniref:DUF6533 domain-containing protein n=1 Tax=Mycena metata TaxID=1033252 RepID=A0AAD7K358_9AGAR|nr:hypothetical protein B0H16DRAFT_1879405 [Mycena metata]
MSSAAELELEHEILQLIADARTTNCLALAGLSVVIYEHLANFPDEFNIMWKSRLSLSNVFYIWIRYFTLVALSVDVSFMLRTEWSDRSCQRFFYTETATSAIITVSADMILIFRVWILYGRSKRLRYLFLALITAELIAMFTIGIYTVKQLVQYVHIGSILGGCYSLEVPRLFTYYNVPFFIVAVTMFSMTLYNCGSTLMTLGLGNTPMISLFMRDGLFWFLALLMLSIVELILWARARPTLAQIPAVPGTACVAVIAARVLLNIKQLASQTAKGGTSMPTMQSETEMDSIPARVRGGHTERVPWFLKTDIVGDHTQYAGPGERSQQV